MSALERRLQILEARRVAGSEVLVVLLHQHKPTPLHPPVLRACVGGDFIQQNDDETEAAFRDRVTRLSRQAPGQTVVLLDEADAEV